MLPDLGSDDFVLTNSTKSEADVRVEDERESDRRALGAAATSPELVEQEPLPFRCALRALVHCGLRTLKLTASGRIHQPRSNVGRTVTFADGTSSKVYRETVIDRPGPASPAVLVVCFRLRWIRRASLHRLFRLESELNTILFAGFPGLVSKLWLRDDDHGLYRGVYQWDGAGRAVAYVRALWWVLALVSERDSIHYAVLPRLDRDQVLEEPDLIDGLTAAAGGWWRPASAVASET